MIQRLFGMALFFVLLAWTARMSPAEDKPATPAKGADAKLETGTITLYPKDQFWTIAEKRIKTGVYDPKNGSTFCNYFTRDFVKDLLGHPLPELNGQANDQITKMTASPDWEKAALVYKEGATGKNKLKGMTAKELQDLQDKGTLVVY